MALSFHISQLVFPRSKYCCRSSPSASLANEIKIVKRAKDNDKFVQEQRIEMIRQALRRKVELSVSSYDTAWVAMVPSPGSPQSPCFPECINWILENQHPDGSWGLNCRPSYLLKDALSSTLACILALRRWNIGEEYVKRGLYFIGSNFSSATADDEQHTPIGFGIIFPGMINYAKGLDLNLPISQAHIDAMLGKRDAELKSINGRDSVGTNAYLAYVSEGLGKLQDWEKLMKYQSRNGSLFNSPATTAAALSHLWDAKGHQYLSSLLQEFGHAVPTVHPQEIYTNLCMVDILERLGIAHHFSDDIKDILDKAYRYWQLDDDQINMDIVTRAMAFRILRMNGYKVSAGKMDLELNMEDILSHSVDGFGRDVSTVQELHKASQFKLFSNEETLDKLNSWTSNFLKHAKSNNLMLKGQHRVVAKEVDYATTFPLYANIERLEHRRSIEQYNLDNLKILKTSYRSQNIDSKDLLELAVADFNLFQSIHMKELELLERWVKENRLDEFQFARQKSTYCYFNAVATAYQPEASDFRMSFAKTCMLCTVIDDFFDNGSSREEQIQLIELVRKWNGKSDLNCCSEQIQTLFSALYCTINELGAKARAFGNGLDIDQLFEIWLTLMESMLIEADWMRDKAVPTMDEYMENGYVSFALGPILISALYFLDPELTSDIIKGDEYQRLFKLLSTCGRLLNDLQSSEREKNEGKLECISLYMLHHGCSEEEAKRDVRRTIDTCRAELLGLVLQNEGSVVPRSCKDALWNICKLQHRMFLRNDGFTSTQEMASTVNAVLQEPFNVPYL